MKALDFSPGIRWLFCFAHPDDELAVAAFLKRLVQYGATVSAAWFHSTPIRQAESESAAIHIGIGRSVFLDFPDGGFVHRLPELQSQVTEVIASVQPDRIVCASFEQGHLDHDSLNWAVCRAFRGPIIEFPEYWPYSPKVRVVNRFPAPEGEEVLELSPGEQAWKRCLARMYPSQGIRGYLGWYEVWKKLMLRPANLIRTERVRVQPGIDYMTPAHAGRIRERILRSPEWKTWMKAISQF